MDKSSMQERGQGKAGPLDLHSHSVFSDGSCTVSELIEQARSAGLAGIAVTDHDAVSQLAAVRGCARETGFPVLAGVEVSACNPVTGRSVHILGFGLQATPDGSGPLDRMVGKTLRERTVNSLWQAWRIWRVIQDADDPAAALAAHGVAAAELLDSAFSLDTVLAVASSSTGVYKQHIMEALLHKGRTDPLYQTVFRSLFKGSGIASHDISYPDAASAVRAIRE